MPPISTYTKHVTGFIKLIISGPNLFQLQELLRSLEELLDDVQSVDKGVESLEDQMLLEIPGFRLLLPLEVGWQFALEFPEGCPELVGDLEGHQDFVQRFFNLDLRYISKAIQSIASERRA